MFRHLPPTAAQFAWPIWSPSASGSEREAQFQAALSQYLGVDTCYLSSSGRTALYLLLKAIAGPANRPTRTEIVLPAYTCPALVKVILDVGLQPRPVDISPHTLEFDYDRLAAAVSEQTLAVICVHPFGLPHPLEPIRALTEPVGAMLIEDAAQSMGARWQGQPVGTRGDFGLFSLGPGKSLSTGGGGFICVNHLAYRESIEQAWTPLASSMGLQSGLALVRFLLLSLAFHPAGWWLATRLRLQQVGDHEASWGYTVSGLTPAQAAIGLSSLPQLDENNQKRRANARRLLNALAELDDLQIPIPPAAAEPIYLRFPLLAASLAQREALLTQLSSLGIGAGRMYQQPLPKIFPHIADASFPGATQVAERLLTLPTHHYLRETDIAKIAHTFRTEEPTRKAH
jgi:dTDP-4-amino-4,6-dideoxygalactose transaminase